MGYGVDGWCWLLEWGVPFLTGQKGDGKSRTAKGPGRALCLGA
jgi:hypothetical protein